MFHIITNLELLFDGLADAERYIRERPAFVPRIPVTAMLGEDVDTPRICVAPTLEKCVTALKPLGVFRRCLNANADAKSYENDDEAYPIIVARFGDDVPYVRPSVEQVPDLRSTGERWILEPTRPVSMEIRWLGAYSIKIHESRHTHEMLCSRVSFIGEPAGYHHPWLDGQGHPLDNSDLGPDPYPDAHAAQSQLWYDYSHDGRLCYAVPTRPFDGRCEMYPLDTSIGPYKAYMDNIARFSGYVDQNGYMILDGSLAKLGDTLGNIRYNGVAWTFLPCNSMDARLLTPDDVGPDFSMPAIRLMDVSNLSPVVTMKKEEP